ncbi:MAG: SlyX family protein [Polyangiaceae bacterium]
MLRGSATRRPDGAREEFIVEDRIVELELRYMELKRSFEELSTVVATHEKTLERVAAQLHATTSRLRDLTEQTGTPVGDEPPPHY